MALARHHAAARPAALGFLYVGRARPRILRHARCAEDARGPAEVPRPGHRGDLGHRRRRRPGVHGHRRAVAVPGRAAAGPAPAAAPGRGGRTAGNGVLRPRGWSPALFADVTGAGFDLLTYRKGPVADLPAEEFSTVACADDRGRSHEYELADTTVALEIGEGPRKGEHVTLRQVTRREAASRGAIRQVHTLTSRTDVPAGEVCWRMSSRWRRRTSSATRAPTSPSTRSTLRRGPRRPGPPGAQPGEESRRRAGAAG